MAQTAGDAPNTSAASTLTETSDAVEGLAVLVYGTVQRDAQRRIVHRRREHAQVQLGVLDGCEDLVHVRHGCLQGNRVNGIEISPPRRYLSPLCKVFII